MSEPITVAELLQDRERLRAALRPFARAAAGFGARPGVVRLVSTARGDILLDDLRAAAEALTASERA